MQKVLVSGAGGFVGARIMQQWLGRFELCTFPRGMLAGANEAEIAAFVQTQRPNCILHTAAISDTGVCEKDPEASYRANVLVPLWMARAAKQTGAKLVAFSSDQVYAGIAQAGPLPEELELHPKNVYGRHKLEAEQRVLDCLPDAVLLRATWMYDLPGYGLPIRGNLPLNLVRAAAAGENVCFSRGDHRGVTYVRQVIENLVPAFALPGGVYNFGSENELNAVETARAFAREMGLRVSIGVEDWQRNLSMDCAKLRGYGINFDTTQEGLVRCLRDYGLR